MQLYYHDDLTQLAENSEHCFILLLHGSQGNKLLFTSAMKPVLSCNASYVRKKKSKLWQKPEEKKNAGLN